MGGCKADKEPERGLSAGDVFWRDASTLTIEGKGWEETEDFFDRLPRKAKGAVREAVWSLSKNSSGISVHFTSDASSLSVRWDGFNAAPHMPATGVSGVDLYVRHENRWRWLGTGRPYAEMNEQILFSGLKVEKREYILYLPLYNPVRTVKLGIPAGFVLQPSAPRGGNCIVFYGTSITQGASASRPGMCYSAIIGRGLDCRTVNLGFAANGIMESEIIDLLCELDPDVYVLDNLPNMKEERIKLVEEKAVRKLRSARPETPIVLIDSILYCNAYLVKENMDRYKSSNRAQLDIYRKLVSEGVKGLHYVKDENLIGADGEATVDGVHLTDLGHMRFAGAVAQVLKNLLSSTGASARIDRRKCLESSL